MKWELIKAIEEQGYMVERYGDKDRDVSELLNKLCWVIYFKVVR